MGFETLENNKKSKILKKRKWWHFVFIGFLAILVLSVAWFFYKTSNVLTIAGDVGVYEDFKVKKEDNRLDILVLGIRGAGDENGGLLADTMILISFDKEKQKAAIVSLPRDLFVEMPEHEKLEKINFAYALGESRRWGGGGLALSKEVVKYITGVYIDHAIVLNFEGFKELIDTMGGVTIYRDTPFVEGNQWQGEGKEASPFWRLVTNTENFEDNDEQKESEVNLTDENFKLETQGQYWEFYVPTGKSVLNGDAALYYVRSRFGSSDFDRIKRQQEVVDSLKNKALSLGVLGNPIKIFSILDIVGDNIRTDMGLGDIREMTNLAQSSDRIPVETGFLDTSQGGLLTAKTINGSFVLVPSAGDENFDEIRKFFKNIFQ